MLYTIPEEMTCLPDHYLVCKEGYVEGVYQDLPQAAAHLPLYNCGDQIILPGMSDLHVHAGQYAYRGLGMDLELLDWLNEYAFPEEARFSDEDYAQKLYSLFAERVRHSTTVSSVGTIHAPATEILMAELAAAGLKGFVGKQIWIAIHPSSVQQLLWQIPKRGLNAQNIAIGH